MVVVGMVSLAEVSPGAGVGGDSSSEGSDEITLGTKCGYVTALALENR